MFENLKGDRVIWFIVVIMSIFSLLAVYSATGSLAFRHHGGDTERYLVKQVSLLGVGFVVMYLAHLVNYTYYSRIAQLILYVSIPLLLLTLLLGPEINEARRWITLPFLDISFQTSDLAKLGLIMYTARMLSKKQHIIKNFDRAFLPILIPIVVVCMLIVPADLSTAVLLFLTCIILMFVGRVMLKQIGSAVLVGIIAFLVYFFVATITPFKGRIGTWKSRLTSFVSPNADHYQADQSKIAIARGGILGQGPGKSLQRNFLPQPYSDFIYAIILEEYGLLGGLIVMFLYLGLLYRAIKIFIKSPGA
ncbi:MAG: FtsW/RodA/SpoVE family cell cycle protein, partial [Chitinophagales bacterium]